MALYGRVNIGGTVDKGLPPGNITNLKIKVNNGKLTLFWEDPDDTKTTDGTTIVQWTGTKVVYKQGGYPTNENDGTVAVDSQVRNQYATNGFELNGLNNGTTYYIQLFPYSAKKAINNNAENRIEGTPQAYRIMTVSIDINKSNPQTRVTLEDDAVGTTPEDREEFIGRYPCILKNGVEIGKLNPNDYTKFEDGTPADITSGDAGDAMMCYPRRGLNISTINDKIKISFTDEPDNPDFEYMAHKRGNIQKDKFYRGIYMGSEQNGTLRSLSGKTIANNKNIGQFRTLAQANGKADGNGGSGYDQTGFYQLLFRQCCYILKNLSTDSQTTSGKGYTASNHSSGIATGGTETWGMNSELIKQTNPTYLTDGNHHCKEGGEEDPWGNLREFIDGYFSNSSYHAMTATDNFNNNATGYTDRGQIVSSSISGWLSKVTGDTFTGFTPKEVNGSATTYYCDYANFYSSDFPAFGGYWNDGSYAGVFFLHVNYSASGTYSSLGGRLMYL